MAVQEIQRKDINKANEKCAYKPFNKLRGLVGGYQKVTLALRMLGGDTLAPRCCCRATSTALLPPTKPGCEVLM